MARSMATTTMNTTTNDRTMMRTDMTNATNMSTTRTDTMRGGPPGRRRDTGESFMERLRIPYGFNERPFKTLCFKPHHLMLFMFILTLIVGIGMIVVGSVGGSLGLYLLLWCLGGVIKLVGAVLCYLVLSKTTRNYILAYLTETIMEAVLVLLAFFAVFMLMLVEGGRVVWETNEVDEAWFSSVRFKLEMAKLSKAFGRSALVVLGVTFIPLVLLLALLMLQLLAVYRFAKYVESRNNFIIRFGDRKPPPPPPPPRPKPPPESAISRVGPETQRDNASQRRSEPKDRSKIGTAAQSMRPRELSVTMPSKEPWVGSSRRQSTLKGAKKAPKLPKLPATGDTLPRHHLPPGKSTRSQIKTGKALGAPTDGEYATVNPPDLSEIKRERRERRMQGRN